MSVTLILLVLAFVCFVLGAAQAPIPRANLTALGLAFWVLSLILGSGAIRGAP
jgi:hypothetical protein